MGNYLFIDLLYAFKRLFLFLESHILSLFLYILCENLMPGQEKNNSYFHIGSRSGVEIQLLSSAASLWPFIDDGFSRYYI